MKKCKKCTLSKPLADFSINKSTKDGYDCYCRLCKNKYRREWAKANPNKTKQYGKQFRRDRADTYLRHKLRFYNLTVEGYKELFLLQQGRCLICKRHQSELKSALAVDHCHKTGKVRGLLCRAHNVALGMFSDNPELLRLAALYIEVFNT